MSGQKIVPNDEFVCPLTLRVMKDPVMTITGRSFERVAIIEWLAHGNTTCPLSRQELQLSDLVTNHSLHAKINKWKQHRNETVKKSNHQLESTSFTDDDDDDDSSSSCFEDDCIHNDTTKNVLLPFFVNMSTDGQGQEGVLQQHTGNDIVIQRRIRDMMNNPEQWEAFQQRVQEQLRKELKRTRKEQQQQQQYTSSLKLGCGMKKLWNDIRKGTLKNK